MTLSKLHQTILTVLVLVLLGLGFWWLAALQGQAPALPEPPKDDSAEEAGNSSLETELVPSAPPAPKSSASRTSRTLPSISPKDRIVSWTYDGFLADNGAREAEARKQIATLQSKLEGNLYDYQTYVGIAQLYDHLGDGKAAYENLSHAIAIDSATTTTGIAWNNVGVLMEKLGAYYTARAAFDEAIQIQPGIRSFHISRIELMINHFPNETVAVEQAFKDAEAILGAADSQLLDLRARWQSKL